MPEQRKEDRMKSLLKQNGANLNRPYEKCLMYGAHVLGDAELLAVILRCGTKGITSIELAERILRLGKPNEGLLCLTHLTVQELMRMPGVGEVKAIQLKCIGELSKRIAMQSHRPRLSFTQPYTVADYYMEQLRHKEKEELILVMLDTKSRLLGDAAISKGTVNASLVSTRELFLEALRYGAVSILLIHNHPSGDPTPSEEDIQVTEKVRQAGELMEIRLVDHIIIGDQCYLSFAEAGLLDRPEDLPTET